MDSSVRIINNKIKDTYKMEMYIQFFLLNENNEYNSMDLSFYA